MSLLKQSEKLNRRVGEPQAYLLIRSLAAKNFEILNWPSKKMESWKYSPVQKLQTEFTPQIDEKNSEKSSKDFILTFESLNIEIKNYLNSITNTHFESIIIYNGRIVESTKLDHPIDKNSKINEDSLFELLTLKNALEKGIIDSLSLKNDDNKLEALNLSYFDQGYLLYINENTKLNKPIHLIHIYSSPEEKPLFQSRLQIMASKGSQASILETHAIFNISFQTTATSIVSPAPLSPSKDPIITQTSESELTAAKAPTSTSTPTTTTTIQNSTSTFTPWNNSTTFIKIDDEARLNYIQWNEIPSNHQITHRTHVTLKNKTHFHFLQGSTSDGWMRNELSVNPEGSDSEILLHGIGLSKKTGIIDQPSKINFSGPNNQCQQIFKNLLLGQSRAIFNGQIKIQPSAQKTNSSQLHQSLLLSTEAEVDTKPELEIYADDVKATHGAAIGQLNEDELFYFQSRGISKNRAHTLVCLGFLSELCDHLTNTEIQTYLKSRIKEFWMKDIQ